MRGPAALFAGLALSAGCGRVGFDPRPTEWTFVDENRTQFDQGQYTAGDTTLEWRDGFVQLAGVPPFAANQTGVFVSRPFETGDPRTVWDTLAWVPAAPSGRPLPDGGSSDAGYATGGIDMTSNMLLLHLDGTGTEPDGSVIPDASGTGRDGRTVLMGQLVQHIPGVFGAGVDIDRDAWIHLDGNYFDFGTGDFTWAIWTRMYPCADSNNNRIAMGGAGAGDNPHMWFGNLCPGDPCGTGGDNAFVIFLDGTRNGGSVNVCSGTRLDDGTWHHLVAVKQGHTAPAATIRLYEDAREVGSSTYDYGAATFDYDGGEIRLGSFNLSDPQYNTRIILDEASMWKRALSASEVEALYRRGAVRLELQLRVCADGRCDDEPFVGPDGTAASVFTEADLVGAPGSQRDNLTTLQLVGPVAQYRARFTTAFAGASPQLARVSLHAAR